MEKATPSDLIPIEKAGEKTERGAFFFLVAASQGKVEIFRPGSDGYHVCPTHRIKEYIDKDTRNKHCGPTIQYLSKWQSEIDSIDELYISEQDAIFISKRDSKDSLSAIDKLMICEINFTNNRQQEKGFDIWRKNVSEKFKTGLRAAIAVISYCHHQGKKLKKSDLEHLLDYPEQYKGAEALVKYKGKVPSDLIQDIYTELPQEYRYSRGEKSK